MDVCCELLYCGLKQGELPAGGALRVQPGTLRQVPVGTAHQSHVLYCALENK